MDDFEVCQLCGNPLKDKEAPCMFCGGNRRKALGVDWGWMYEREFYDFQRTVSFLALSTFLYCEAVSLRNYSQHKPQPKSSDVEQKEDWISFWGASRSGKTFLLNAFLQTVLYLPAKDKDPSFTIRDYLDIQALIGDFSNEQPFLFTYMKNVWPIASTQNHNELDFYIIKQLRSRQKKQDGWVYKPVAGLNSQIHHVFFYDSKGGWHVGNTDSIKAEEIQAEESRKQIARSKYLVIVLNGEDDVDNFISGLNDLISRISANQKYRKIAICLNKIERTPTFKKNYSDEGKLQEKEVFHECLREACKKTQYPRIRSAIENLESCLLAQCDIRYFCISSCGYLNGNWQEINLNGNQLKESGIAWKPINVFPVLSWILEDIELARIDCQSEFFARFDQIPDNLRNFLNKLHIDWKSINQKRLKKYIKYSELKK